MSLMQPGALVSAVLYLGMFAMALMCFAATQWLLDNMDGIPGRLTAAFFACVGILLPSAMAGFSQSLFMKLQLMNR